MCKKEVKNSRTNMTYLAGLHIIGVKGLFHADRLDASRHPQLRQENPKCRWQI
jgi:hypothetical protein